MVARTEAIKSIWIKEAQAAIHRKSTPPIALAITYMVGFLTGMGAHHWWLAIVGAATYLIFYFLWRQLQKLLKVWDIPTKF